jgi:hypothetical protein
VKMPWHPAYIAPSSWRAVVPVEALFERCRILRFGNLQVVCCKLKFGGESLFWVAELQPADATSHWRYVRQMPVSTTQHY